MYHVMAKYYDALTADVPYEEFAEFLMKIFRREKASPGLILDLACGTGSITKLLAERGYDMIGADSSPDMLMQAQAKCSSLSGQPTFICQNMTDLDLYGTVDAVVSFLDSVNYLADPADLRRAFERVSLFLNPGGLFVFDLNTAYKLSSIAGNAFVRETDGLFCVWQAAWNEKNVRPVSISISLKSRAAGNTAARARTISRELMSRKRSGRFWKTAEWSFSMYTEI